MVSQLSRDHLEAYISGPSLDELMARNDGLVHAVLRRQWGGSLDYEARLQAGRIGLWHAIVGYDPKHGATFSTYAWPAIEHEIWRAVRQVGPVSLAPPVWPLPSLPDEPDEALLEAELDQTLHALVQRLPIRLRQIVVAYYGLAEEPPCSLRQLGKRLGLSHEAVRLRLWAAHVWLRHPAHSLVLRQLLGRNSVADYQLADTAAQAWLRRRGGPR
jgi:RNA polymerase sigma factor (sigma-70 family)